MVIRAGYLAVAQKLQEAALAMSHADIQQRISDDLNDQCRGTGNWCYLVAVFGDDAAGDCVYSCNGELKRGAYTCSPTGAKVDMATAVDVVPLTTYEVESAELSEAGARNSRRDLSQLQTIHDSAAALGANCSMAESAKKPNENGAPLKLNESAATMEAIVIQEAKADYEIKLIAPGKGSSAFYPAEVLKRDGPKVFKASTHVYLNHPTAAEEASRPEGDVSNLAGVLTTDAVYSESHAKGPGLYARMKVFADHAQMVEEKAPHVGMSIRASGIAESNRREGGLPVLKELTGAESVDVVTRAGAGGMILTEAARGANPTQESSSMPMDENEMKLLRETVAATTATTTALLKKEIRREAIAESARILKDVSLPAASKEYIIETVVERGVPEKDGLLDSVALTEAVNAEARRFGAAIGVGPKVSGMGTATQQVDPAEATRLAEAQKRSDAVTTDAWTSLMGGDVKLAERAMKGRVN